MHPNTKLNPLDKTAEQYSIKIDFPYIEAINKREKN